MRCIRVLIQIIVISLAPIVVDSFSGALNPVRSISTPDITKRRERLQAKFDSLHAAGQFPGATAGFVLADGSSFGLATGFSDKTKKIRMTSAGLMLQGSVGKTYVAATALQLVHESKAFDPSLLPQMLDGIPAKLGPNTKYGLGVIIRQTPFGTSYGHSGFFPGYLTEMMYFPDAKIAIAVQVNTSVPRATGKPLTRFIYDFARIIVEEQNR